MLKMAKKTTPDDQGNPNLQGVVDVCDEIVSGVRPDLTLRASRNAFLTELYAILQPEYDRMGISRQDQPPLRLLGG